jgi:integrase
VPLHPLLVELGFLDFLAEVKAAGQKRLFPNLKLKRGTFAQDFSRWWGHYVRTHVTTDRKKAAAHSLRHSWINAMKQARADEAVLKELAGHSHGASSLTLSVYGQGYEPRILLAEFSKLNLGVEDELRKLPRWSR